MGHGRRQLEPRSIFGQLRPAHVCAPILTSYHDYSTQELVGKPAEPSPSPLPVDPYYVYGSKILPMPSPMLQSPGISMSPSRLRLNYLSGCLRRKCPMRARVLGPRPLDQHGQRARGGGHRLGPKAGAVTNGALFNLGRKSPSSWNITGTQSGGLRVGLN